jgi:hypothetical protein
MLRLRRRRNRDGLSAALRRELKRIGSPVRNSRRGDRSVQVRVALDGSLHAALWSEGVSYLNGWAANISELAAAVDAWLSDARPGGEEMAARFAFLTFNDHARAYERGDAIELVWRNLLTVGPDFDRLRPLVEAAAAEPALRRLLPWTSMDRLCFSRWVGWPFSNDLPFAAPRGEGFRVYQPSLTEYLRQEPDDLLGEGDAAHAVELLVAALPDPLDVVYRKPSDTSGKS